MAISIPSRVFLILCFLFNSHLAWTDDEATSYSFGVVPQQSAKRLAALWTPVLAYLSKYSGIDIHFKTAKNIPEFEKRLAKGEYDFAYMNPYHFTVFNRDPGYKALAVRKNQPIKGIVVVRKDSSIKQLSDLANSTLAFPSPAAFAASVLPKAQLDNNKIPFTPKYVSSHDSVYLNVVKGLFPAGGGVKRTLNNTAPRVREKLKILWTTNAFTPHAIAAHPRIDDSKFTVLQSVLVDMAKTDEGKKLLKNLKIKNGLIRAVDSDWNDVRELKLAPLNSLSK